MAKKKRGATLLALILVVFAASMIQPVKKSIGDTAGASGWTCRNGITVTDTYIDFSCVGTVGAQCDLVDGWSFNGISDNAGHVAVSQSVCENYKQTWDGQCKFDNLAALAPYATGTAYSPGWNCVYVFPLGFNCERRATCYSGGAFEFKVNARWNVPPNEVIVTPPIVPPPCTPSWHESSTTGCVDGTLVTTYSDGCGNTQNVMVQCGSDGNGGNDYTIAVLVIAVLVILAFSSLSVKRRKI